MTNKRYKQLNGPVDHKLTFQELSEGWHFCEEFDGLCRNSNEESFKCSCNEYQDRKHDAHCCAFANKSGMDEFLD